MTNTTVVWDRDRQRNVDVTEDRSGRYPVFRDHAGREVPVCNCGDGHRCSRDGCCGY